MPDITFKFDVGDRVKTNLDDEGMIDSATNIGTGPHRYYVKFKGGRGSYFDEDDLSLME